MMAAPKVEKNKVVSVTYSILDEHGTVLEQVDVPTDYLHGVDHALFPKIEAALNGKSIGDTIDVKLSPEEGFGPSDPSLMFTDDMDNVPPEFRTIGAKPTFVDSKGNTVEFVVTKIENGKLTVDSNHPFAGKAIDFHVTVVAIRDATEAELKRGISAEDAKSNLH